MAKKRGKAYVPSITNLQYSGVSERDWPQVRDELTAAGAQDIAREPDDGDYSAFPDDPGPYWVVTYRK